MTVGGVLGAVTNLLPYFLRNLLHNHSGDCVTNLLRNLHTDLLRDFLLHIDRVLSANCLGKLLAFFSWNINWEILAALIRNFLTFGARYLLLYFLWN